MSSLDAHRDSPNVSTPFGHRPSFRTLVQGVYTLPSSDLLKYAFLACTHIEDNRHYAAILLDRHSTSPGDPRPISLEQEKKGTGAKVS